MLKPSSILTLLLFLMLIIQSSGGEYFRTMVLNTPQSTLQEIQYIRTILQVENLDLSLTA